MPTAKKAVVKKAAKMVAPKKVMNPNLELYVYRKVRGTGYNKIDRVYVLGSDGAMSNIEVNFNGLTPEVTVSNEPDFENKIAREYCPEFMELTECGELPPNQLIKWSITATVVPPVDKKAIQKQILEEALKKLG